jgi:general secretion pathway protein A
MFLTHFKMSDHPFSEKPPIDWLLADNRFDQAMARLKFFQQQGNIALIIGQTGIGKSSLLRLFQQQMPQNLYHPIYLHLTNISPSSFLRLIVTELGESPKFGKDRLFLQIIERIRKNEIDTVLIIDEAHLIASQALTDLRLLVSSGIDTNLPLKIVLSGQEALGSVLKRSDHADLVHRICVRCHLNPLTKSQTTAYIDNRLRCSDSSEKIFEAQAKDIIHDYSGGVPRQINNIATACLINASTKNRQTVDETLVNETMTEFYLP